MLEFGQKGHEVMHAAVRLLRAGFEQIEKLFVVPKKFSDRKHKTFSFLPLAAEPGQQILFFPGLLLVPEGKRVGEDNIAEKAMRTVVRYVKSGIHLQIMGDVAGEPDGG